MPPGANAVANSLSTASEYIHDSEYKMSAVLSGRRLPCVAAVCLGSHGLFRAARRLNISENPNCVCNQLLLICTDIVHVQLDLSYMGMDLVYLPF